MKSVQIGALIAVIVGCAAYLLYYQKSQPEPGDPVAMRLPACCSSCGKAYVTQLGKIPAKCLECGQMTLMRAAKCRGCGTIYPAQVGSGVRNACPKCKKTAMKEIGANELPEK